VWLPGSQVRSIWKPRIIVEQPHSFIKANGAQGLSATLHPRPPRSSTVRRPVRRASAPFAASTQPTAQQPRPPRSSTVRRPVRRASAPFAASAQPTAQQPRPPRKSPARRAAAPPAAQKPRLPRSCPVRLEPSLARRAAASTQRSSPTHIIAAQHTAQKHRPLRRSPPRNSSARRRGPPRPPAAQQPRQHHRCPVRHAAAPLAVQLPRSSLPPRPALSPLLGFPRWPASPTFPPPGPPWPLSPQGCQAAALVAPLCFPSLVTPSHQFDLFNRYAGPADRRRIHLPAAATTTGPGRRYCCRCPRPGRRRGQRPGRRRRSVSLHGRAAPGRRCRARGSRPAPTGAQWGRRVL
jgi:hypothetical protein